MINEKHKIYEINDRFKFCVKCFAYYYYPHRDIWNEHQHMNVHGLMFECENKYIKKDLERLLSYLDIDIQNHSLWFNNEKLYLNEIQQIFFKRGVLEAIKYKLENGI